MDNTTMAAPARKQKEIDLKYQPGFPQIAWLCIVVLYAPIAVLVVSSNRGSASVPRPKRVPAMRSSDLLVSA